MASLKDFDLEHWWKMLAGAGVAIVVASIAVKFVPTILIGLGLLLIGLGEWRMHPRIQYPVGTPLDGGIVTITPRMLSPLGLAADGLGGLLGVVGLIKLVLA